MSFTRIKYDDCALKLRTERSVDPGNYRLFNGFSNNCGKCFSYHGPRGSREDVSLTYQEITEKISEFRIEMDKRLTWEEENIGEVQ